MAGEDNDNLTHKLAAEIWKKQRGLSTRIKQSFGMFNFYSKNA